MIPDITWSKPITVLKADTYKEGAWKGETDFAVQINAGNQLIVFENCKFAGAMECVIKAWGGTKIRLLNCELYGIDPVDQWSRFFNGYDVMQFEMINCYIEHTGGGLIERWAGDLNAPLIIRYNQFRNTDNRRKDGTKGSSKHSGFMIKDTSMAGGLTNVDIGWNESINEVGKSLVEDNWNLFNAKGTPDKPIMFHHNLVRGAFPDPITDVSYTGTGFTTDSGGGSNTFESVTSYVKGEYNVFLDCQNSAINIAIGHDVHFDDTNVILNSGLTPLGVKIPKAWAGCAIFDSNMTAQPPNADNPIFGNNSIKNNLIGSMSWGQNYPYKDRQDEMNDRGTGQWQNRMPAGQNRYMAEGSVTPAAVEAAAQAWYKSAKDAGVVTGLGGNGTVTPNKPDLSLKLGQKANGKVTPKNAKGEAVTYQAGSLKVVSSDDAIAAMKIEAGAVVITPVKIGSTSGTVSFMSNGGKLISKLFTMEVLAADNTTPTLDNEAVDFDLIFSIL